MENVIYWMLVILISFDICIFLYIKRIFCELSYQIRDVDFYVASIREKLKQEESK